MSSLKTTQISAADDDRFMHWLLDSIEFDSVVLHAGRYCGPWRASTAGHSQASFHLVLSGECYLHLPGQAPLRLGARDGVFLLRDMDHFLSPYSDSTTRVTALPIQALAGGGVEDGTGLACGFFQFHGALGALVIDAFPGYLVSRADDCAATGGAALFELMLAETGADPERPSALLGRLTELLFFYLLRNAARQEGHVTGLLALARRAEFAGLLDELLRYPARDWRIDSMASASNMSRATFYKRFTDACGMPPAQLLVLLRMTIAVQRLKDGDSVERTASHVGYQSAAAFTRAFQRSVGASPGAYRRQTSASALPRSERAPAPASSGTPHRMQFGTFEQEKPTPAHGAGRLPAQ